MTFDQLVKEQNVGTSGYYSNPTTLKMSGGNPAQYLSPPSQPLPELGAVMADNNLRINGWNSASNNNAPPVKTQAQIYAEQQAAIKAAERQAAWDKVNSGREETFQSARDSASDYLGKQQLAARDFARQYGLDMGNLNSSYADTELGKSTAYSGIMDMIDRGIRSAGTMLANRNATNSSASEAFARLYNQLGQREAAGVEQDYQADMRDLGSQYNALTAKKTSFEDNINTNTEAEINKIVGNARNALLTLNEVLADADITDRLQVEQLKEQVKQEARNALAGLSGYAADRTKGISRYSEKQRMDEASKRRQAGQAGAKYDYTSQAPIGMPSAGVSSSSLPLYSNLRARSKDRR